MLEDFARPKWSPPVAVIPAAGFGTRLRPLTDRIPKELLPVGGKLAIEHILTELHFAGLHQAIIVVSPAKAERMRSTLDTFENLTLTFVVQPTMRGLGDAVLCAEPFVEGERFVVALGDAVFESPTPGQVTSRLLEFCFDAPANIGLAVQHVPRAQIGKYGVVSPLNPVTSPDRAFPIKDIVEKPAPADAPSEFAAAARYLLPTTIFDTLRDTKPGINGEIQLTDALRRHLHRGEAGVAMPLLHGEIRYDIGALDSYYRAFIAFALADLVHGAALRESLAHTFKNYPTRTEEPFQT